MKPSFTLSFRIYSLIYPILAAQVCAIFSTRAHEFNMPSSMKRLSARTLKREAVSTSSKWVRQSIITNGGRCGSNVSTSIFSNSLSLITFSLFTIHYSLYTQYSK